MTSSGRTDFLAQEPYGGIENMCVEVADLDHGGRAVRDSKDSNGPALTFTAAQWTAFTTSICTGQFD